MCGIAGFLGVAGAEEGALRARAEGMAETIRHRGPDRDGCWVDAACGIALAHRRLSIIDLSDAGSQPMVSSCGRYVISYNGEIYNADELRRELNGRSQRFRGHSDTEVIVEGFGEWGVRRTVCRLIGMFAFAVWDRVERRLWLARDRLGIKPIYWTKIGGMVLFGSELKALRAYPEWNPKLNRDAVAAFLRHNYIPCPHTIYEGVYKLKPGCLIRFEPDQGEQVDRYWDLAAVAMRGMLAPNEGKDEEVLDELEALLGDAVRRRMVADVPLGAFLSGGVDSSAVVALMQRVSGLPVRTFSIGFQEHGYDEAQYAKQVAEHLGTDHTELYVSSEHAREVIPNLADIYDEPFADSSQIPTYCVSALTREHVTVSLSGDGGDELFAGYNRYFHAEAIASKLERLPRFSRDLMAGAMRSLAPGTWTALFEMVPRRWRPPQAGDKMHKLAEIVAGDKDTLYRRLVSHWEWPERIVQGAEEPRGVLWDDDLKSKFPNLLERMQYLDTVTYLPDDILTKVDRSSMAVSLEARVPLLDHRVVEMAWRLPLRMKIRNGQSKWALRQILYRHVPRALIDRPKMGFGVPIHEWLRGPLRAWAEELLDEKTLREDGIFEPEPIRVSWREHIEGRRNWQYHLWDVLMFQAWKRRWM